MFKRPLEEAEAVPAVSKSIKMETDDHDNGSSDDTSPSAPVMTSQQIKDMMANAQRMIEQRKRALLGVTGGGTPTTPPMVGVVPPLILVNPPANVVFPPTLPKDGVTFDGDKKLKLAELQAQIQSKIASGALGRQQDMIDASFGKKPLPLLLDNEGRAIDVSGKQILLPQHQPTLKANIRAASRKEYKSTGQEVTSSSSTTVSDEVANKYFDERLAPVAAKARGKRSLKFNDPGKYVALAHRQRMQLQLARLQEEIADKARKTGISTAARLAKLSGAVANSSEGKKSEEYIPQVEWWDSLLFDDKEAEAGTTYDSKLKVGAITKLIEHPTQLRCPTEPLDTPLVPVFLTKKEMKKLRRQNRRETWKEKQEKIRLGLEPPPAPKVRISNLMRVLGVEAVQDPTKMEAHVRKEMAKRLKTHHESNVSRKLTPEQRKEKKAKKMEEDVTLGVQVAVYRIDDLTNQSKKFKVDTNAKQLMLTGCLLLFRDCNLVVVEGGPKQQKKYKKLLLNRIKWTEDNVKDKETKNKCVIVWEGAVKERAFSELKFKLVQTEEQAREFLKKHGNENYWDLALSGSVLEGIIDT